MKKGILMLGILVVVGFLSACTQIADDSHSNEEPFVKTFGPGLGAHTHAISLLQFDTVEDITLDAFVSPKKDELEVSQIVEIDLLAKEVVSEIAPNVSYLYWTYNETVPGPFLRIKEGDTVKLTLNNDITSSHNHSIDLHAVTGPGGGAKLTDVAPGESGAFQFKALNPGLYVYHCATPNVPLHVANGMYGLILVEPEEGLPEVDKEFYVMQGELYTEGILGEEGHQDFSVEKMLNEDPEYVVFNGRVNGIVDEPLKAEVGDKIRVYFGNGGVSLTSSFHVIGEIFDTVYPEASTSTIKNVQTTSVPAGGATMVEFKLEVPGKYVLVDHALARLDRGAWGLLEVSGPKNEAIFKDVKEDF